MARRAPLAARPCDRAAPETRPPFTAAPFWHYVRASQCVPAQGTLACGADAGLGLRPVVGCSLTALPTLAAPGRGGTRTWCGVPRLWHGPVRGLRLKHSDPHPSHLHYYPQHLYRNHSVAPRLLGEVSGGGADWPYGHAPLPLCGPGASCYLLIRASTSTSRYLVFTRFRRTPAPQTALRGPLWFGSRNGGHHLAL